MASSRSPPREPSVARDGFASVSDAPAAWDDRTATLGSGGLVDVRYAVARGEGIAKITICRPENHNSFRPRTVEELSRALAHANRHGEDPSHPDCAR